MLLSLNCLDRSISFDLFIQTIKRFLPNYLSWQIYVDLSLIALSQRQILQVVKEFFLLRLINFLKGVCHEIFELQFFNDSNPFGPLINRLKYFQIQFDFVEIFDHKVISAVCCTPRRSSPWHIAHQGDHLSCILHTAESISAV